MHEKIPLKKQFYPDQYWLRYVDDESEKKTVSLSACANSFKLVTQGRYASDDGLKCVGWRYEEAGQLCFELFTAGHVVFTTTLYPMPEGQIQSRGRKAPMRLAALDRVASSNLASSSKNP